ncbi:MAG: flavin reductase family protein [Syntrophomonadaceae bacterium]|jgi:flavin reductase (DIM6/NTAB) family NADH-FMN oxidoreductase RutF
MSIRSEYLANVTEMLQQLPLGAFLTVKSGENINTMTIGWGSIGFIWNKPVMMVMVRYSRYTHELIKEVPDFSVSVPLDGHQKKALAGAGTKSGRDIDKFSVYDLIAKPAKSIESPVIDNCGLIYECRILYKHAMEPGLLDPTLDSKFYQDHDYHVLYYGEIVNTYNNRV